MKPEAEIIISRYDEPWEWIKDYTDYYLIYNKGEPIEDNRVINVPNVGGNQRDIFKFIYDNYENLPELMAFVQANPYDHCKKEIFDKLIYNTCFTPLEYYGPTPANGFEARTEDGGFMEINNSWYIFSHNRTYSLNCKYSSFDDFMYQHFTNYQHVDWLRFSPGSQYLIEKRQALHYRIEFWKKMMNELDKNNMTEAHIIERSLWMIFQCNLEERI